MGESAGSSEDAPIDGAVPGISKALSVDKFRGQNVYFFNLRRLGQ